MPAIPTLNINDDASVDDVQTELKGFPESVCDIQWTSSFLAATTRLHITMSEVTRRI